MSILHPFQKLCFVAPPSKAQKILLAATGPYICSFDTLTGKLLSRWPDDQDEDDTFDDPPREGEGLGERPAKRPKLSSADNNESDDSIEIVAERAKGARRKPKVVNTKLPNVSHLCATRNGSHIIAATADDKCIRVLRISSRGGLVPLSERVMPKRLCAVTLTPYEQTILAGDKFGDVYSLPLEPLPGYQRQSSDKPQSDYRPSASELTVHTKGNLEALRQQREQRKLQPRKEGPDFEYKLLLGHVSLLTDVAVSDITVNGKKRQYLLTSDRDEHIRVSRGIPQTHIIENYCHGHKEFVTKLCVVPSHPELLVAGSGEQSLKLYRWQEGRILSEESLRQHLEQALTTVQLDLPPERSLDRLTVSGMWAIICNRSSLYKSPSSNQGYILVTLEGFPFIFSFIVSQPNSLSHHQTIYLSGNVLDVTRLVVPESEHNTSSTILISIDTAHQPASVSTYRSEAPTNFIESFSLNPVQDPELPSHPLPSTDQWLANSLSQPINQTIISHPSSTTFCFDSSEASITAIKPQSSPTDTKQRPTTTQRSSSSFSHSHTYYSPLGEFLYGLENLRKKRGLEAVEADPDNKDEVGEDQPGRS